ncbi:MAG: hypothetical protein MK188_00450 [Gammaproteobacteria bacterium]|nr:hypothetical protein [Gammaproteobacteria bacterium]
MNSKLDDSVRKISTRDIPASWINAHCRNLIAKYALHAFHYDATKFDLRSEQILSDLSDHARRTQSDELHRIYFLLKKELKAIVSSPAYKKAVYMIAEKNDYLTDKFSH